MRYNRPMTTIARNQVRPQRLAYLLAVSIGCMLVLGYSLWAMQWYYEPQNDLAGFLGKGIGVFIACAIICGFLFASSRASDKEVIATQIALAVATLWAAVLASQHAYSPLLAGLFLASGAGVNAALRFTKYTTPFLNTGHDAAAG